MFTGNNDSSSPVTNMLLFPFEARAVMLVPMTWNTGISLRWEILGCLEGKILLKVNGCTRKGNSSAFFFYFISISICANF